MRLLRKRHTALPDTGQFTLLARAAGKRAQMSPSLRSAATTKGARPGHASATARYSAGPSNRRQMMSCPHAGSVCHALSAVAPHHTCVSPPLSPAYKCSC